MAVVATTRTNVSILVLVSAAKIVGGVEQISTLRQQAEDAPLREKPGRQTIRPLRAALGCFRC